MSLAKGNRINRLEGLVIGLLLQKFYLKSPVQEIRNRGYDCSIQVYPFVLANNFDSNVSQEEVVTEELLYYSKAGLKPVDILHSTSQVN